MAPVTARQYGDQFSRTKQFIKDAEQLCIASHSYWSVCVCVCVLVVGNANMMDLLYVIVGKISVNLT